jgi:hypothetical protein
MSYRAIRSAYNRNWKTQPSIDIITNDSWIDTDVYVCLIFYNDCVEETVAGWDWSLYTVVCLFFSRYNSIQSLIRLVSVLLTNENILEKKEKYKCKISLSSFPSFPRCINDTVYVIYQYGY